MDKRKVVTLAATGILLYQSVLPAFAATAETNNEGDAQTEGVEALEPREDFQFLNDAAATTAADPETAPAETPAETNAAPAESPAEAPTQEEPTETEAGEEAVAATSTKAVGGTYGEGANQGTWTLDDQGLLTLTDGVLDLVGGVPWVIAGILVTDIKKVVINNVTAGKSLAGLFKNHYALTGIEVWGSFDTSATKNMSEMFCGCKSITTIPTGQLNTASATTMNRMFYNCNVLTTIDISNFATNKVEDMSAMFSMCSSLKEIDVSGFNTTAVTTMKDMFNGCKKLTELDLSSFNTESLPGTGMVDMFYDTPLTKLLVGKNFAFGTGHDLRDFPEYGDAKWILKGDDTWDGSKKGVDVGMRHDAKRLQMLEGEVHEFRASAEVIDPSITVSGVGLEDLKVGKAVFDAGVTFILADGVYAAEIAAPGFSVTNLPEGLSMGTPQRQSDTEVFLPITGTPTKATTETTTLTIPPVSKDNIVDGQENIMVTGTVTASAIAKGDGATLTGELELDGEAGKTSFKVKALAKPANNQTVEYGISTQNDAGQVTSWQTETTFDELDKGTEYYVFARAKANDNYLAGETTNSLQVTTAADLDAPEITTTELPAGTIGKTYSATLAAKGTVTRWSISQGTLPPGLSLDPDSGVISGTPTVPKNVKAKAKKAADGTKYSFTVKAENDDNYATQELSITILAAVDKTDLIAEIAKAEKLTKSDYTTSSWSNLKTALDAAKTVRDDKDADQEAVDDAENKLKEAMDNLVSLVDLKKLVDEEKTADRKEADYTADSWSAYDEALSAAQEVLGKADATQKEVDDAKTALQTAIAGLKEASKLEITTTKLADGVVGETYSQKLEASEEVTKWTISEGKLPDGLELSETSGVISGTPTKSGEAEFTVKAENAGGSVTKELSITIHDAVNKDALKAEIAKAEKLKKADYTTDSWAAFEPVLAAAKATFDKADATQAEVDEATEKLKKAMTELVSIAELKGLVTTEKAKDRKEADYTLASWKKYAAALAVADATLAKKDATQAEVDQALKDLQSAIDGLKEVSEDENDDKEANNTTTGNTTTSSTQKQYPATGMSLATAPVSIGAAIVASITAIFKKRKGKK